MSPIFWGLVIAMSLVATSIVAAPLWAGRNAVSKTMLTVCAAVPMVAAVLYAGVGSPSAVASSVDQSRQSISNQPTMSGRQESKSAGSIGSLLPGLEERLQRKPDDAGSWLLLAKSYEHLGQSAKAIAAYERARALGKSDAELERSLLSAPTTSPKLPVPSASGPAIRGRVVLGPNAAALVEPSDIVFIFAKQSLEQRMPIVALRRPAAELPIDFVMTDSDAMVAGTQLANFESLVVTAKISRSGLATDVVDDLETWSNAVSPIDGEIVELLITVGAGDE